jgi:hypothetical protein
MPMSYECAVHKHRSWVPIERHHVWPRGLGGPDVESNKISVCANGHYEIHAYLDHLIKGTWGAVERHFGAKVKRYARSGWEQAGRPTHGGGE